MFGWLFRRARIHYKDDEMLVVKYSCKAGYYYLGSFDTQAGYVMRQSTLEGIGRLIEEAQDFRENRHLPLFERIGLALTELDYKHAHTIGVSREWYFRAGASKIFISVTLPSQIAQVCRNGYERALNEAEFEENKLPEEST